MLAEPCPTIFPWHTRCKLVSEDNELRTAALNHTPVRSKCSPRGRTRTCNRRACECFPGKRSNQSAQSPPGELGSPMQSPRGKRIGATQDSVWSGQEALKAQGFDPGQVDGVYGPSTQTRDRGRFSTGLLNPSNWRGLLVEPQGRCVFATTVEKSKQCAFVRCSGTSFAAARQSSRPRRPYVQTKEAPSMRKNSSPTRRDSKRSMGQGPDRQTTGGRPSGRRASGRQSRQNTEKK